MAEDIIFKVSVDTGDAKSDVDKVGDSIENVGKEAKKTGGSFTSLRKELKDIAIQLQNLDPASKEFEQVAKRAGQIKEQMRGVADAINDADPEKFGGKFQRTAEGIAGAFSAVTGAQALFGQQSEEIEKQLLKVQGAIALTQGISAMKELKNDATDLAMSIKNTVVRAFTSLTAAEMANAAETGTLTLLQRAYGFAVGTSTGLMKAFKIALASTGIGLAVVAIGYLVGKLMDYITNTDAATRAQNNFNTSVKTFNNQQERTRKNLDNSLKYQLDYAKAVGTSEKGLYEIEKNQFKEREKNRQREQDNNNKHIDKLRLQKQNALKNENFDLVKSINEEIINTKKKNNDLIDEKYQLQREEKILTAQHNTDLKKQQQEANKDAIAKGKEHNQKLREQQEKNNKETLEMKRKLEDLIVANIEDTNTRELSALQLKHTRELEEIQNQYGKKKDYAELEKQLKIQQQNELDKLEEEQKKAKDEKAKEDQNKAFEDQKASIQAEIINNAENFKLKQEKQIELENADYEQRKLNAVGNKGELELIEAEHAQKIKEINKEAVDYQKKLDQELVDAKNFLIEQTSNMFGQLASASEQGSKIQKAFAIAQLTVDTAKSISSTIAGATAAAASTGPAAPFVLAGYIAQGIATVTMAMNSAKKILNAPMPSVNAPSMPRPNQQQESATNPTQQQQITASSTYKVVVLDSDITKMQEKSKKTQVISTI